MYFLGYCSESSEIKSISRYKGCIDYIDSSCKKRKYFPDFIVEYNDGRKRVVEIKGSKEYRNFHEKFNAARKKLGLRYVVYGFEDLFEMGIFVKRETYLRKFYKKHFKDITFFKNSRTEALEKRIGKWLK